MNADSIAGTVTAVLCVVVGLLIIGSALVPIVEHASETETTETVTGNNTIDEQSVSLLGYGVPKKSLTASGSSGSVTVDGQDLGGCVILILQNDGQVSIFQHGTQIRLDRSQGEIYRLESLSLTAEDGSFSVEYIEEGEAGTISGSYLLAMITSTELEPLRAFGSDDSIFAAMLSPVTIGSEQSFFCIDTENMSITKVDAESVLPEGMSRTENADGSITFEYSGSNTLFAPLEWTEETTTAERSEYAPLYAIIPIMLILSMAYVLIRRF